MSSILFEIERQNKICNGSSIYILTKKRWKKCFWTKWNASIPVLCAGLKTSNAWRSLCLYGKWKCLSLIHWKTLFLKFVWLFWTLFKHFSIFSFLCLSQKGIKQGNVTNIRYLVESSLKNNSIYTFPALSSTKYQKKYCISNISWACIITLYFWTLKYVNGLENIVSVC